MKIWDARCKDMIVLPDGLLCYEGLNFEPIKDLLLVASIIAARQNKHVQSSTMISAVLLEFTYST